MIVTRLGEEMQTYLVLSEKTLLMLTDSSESWLKTKLEEFHLIKKYYYFVIDQKKKSQTHKAQPK